MGMLTDLRLWAARRRYAPERETLAYPKLTSLMGRGKALGSIKPTPANLRFFSRTPYARRAINAIKGPVAGLQWNVTPKAAFAKSASACADGERIRRCLDQPNPADSFRSLLEQLIEDALVGGAGVLEQAISGDSNRPLWLWPVDALTIQPVGKWDGSPDSVRFYQGIGQTGGSLMSEIDARQLKAKDIVYMRMNPASDSPYGFGPLEIAYMSVARQLGVATYAANVASNAQPQNLIYAGADSQEQLLAFRAYWRNEIEGQGQTPVIGGATKPDVLKLHPGGDDALYLKWQQFLIREIATAFNLSPQNLGLEADVNRNTSEVAEDRDWDAAILPMALMVQAHLNRDVLIGRLGMPHLEFGFVGLDRDDEKANADIYETHYQGNAITPNEYRASIGMPPSKSPWADLLWADVQIAVNAARGSKEIDDPELQLSPKPKET